MTALLLAAAIMTTGNDDLLAERHYMAAQVARCEAVEATTSDETPEAEEIPAEEVNTAENAAQPTYYGVCRITFYCGCSQCCGQWAGGPTASGAMPTPGRTVANGVLPYGTRVLIEGQEYVVEDRGVSGDQFDIYVADHQEALNRGLYYADVYIIE